MPRSLAAECSREHECRGCRGRQKGHPHRGGAGRQPRDRRDQDARPARDGEPGGAATTHVDDREERDHEEHQEREIRPARNDEQGDESEQRARPEIEQQPPTCLPEPVAPGHEHRECVARRRQERERQQEAAVRCADIERQPDEHRQDRRPADQESEPDHRRAEVDVPETCRGRGAGRWVDAPVPDGAPDDLARQPRQAPVCCRERCRGGS